MANYLKKYNELVNSKVSFFGPETSPKPVPAPIKGWNAIAPLANMEPEYAVTLNNWVPRPGWVEMRGGYNQWTQNLSSGAAVQSLMVYRPAASAQRMFAAAGSSIYEVTNVGTYTTSKTGFSGSSRWQYVNFTPSGGSNYMILCNGADSVQAFDGTTWTAPSISGVTSSKLINVNSHMRRLWFVEANSTRVWYLGADAISGTASLLDLGSLIPQGSYIVATSTWTVDGGNGPQALFVALTAKGQAVIYQGTDPTSTTTWTLVGVFDLPVPIGNRCMTKIGSDVAIITNQGLLPLSQALPFNPAAQRSVTFTNIIQNAMLAAAQNAPSDFGWETTLFPQQTLLILNVPVQENSQQVQYVMNTLTGAWCQFTGWNANCFAIFNESLYFGDNNGNVNLAYIGKNDLTAPIVADMKCAFNFFGEAGKVKNLSMAKPYLVADGTLTPTISVDADFADSSPSAPVVTVTPSGGVWDTSTWDNTVWSSGTVAVANWLSTNALGTALAVRMKVNFGGNSTSTSGFGVFDVGSFDTAVFDGSGLVVSSGQGLATLQVVQFETLVQFGGLI